MRVWLVTVAVLLALLLGAGWYGSVQHTRALAAELEVSTLGARVEAAEARTRRIQAGVQKVERERNEAQRGLAQALAGSKEWAISPVPDPVRNELCKRLKCTGVPAMPTPDR